MKTEGHQESLELRVRRFMREHQLLSKRGTLLVAVSGGPDSVCLLHILVRMQEELGIRLHVAHLDHQLRGAEAEADAAYVADLAHRLGLPATIEKRDVKAYQIDKHLSSEEAAREVRYTFLAHVARTIGADRVAVGHTVDDHIETILMHLIRGAGTRGLRGLQTMVAWQFSGNQITVIRPLLEAGREETAAYCRNHQLMPRIDTTNLSLLPLRNRIRHQLLPLLKSYNPRIVEALLRTARIAGDDLAFLDGEVSRIWDSLARWRENTIALDKAGFLGLSPALQRHLLRTSIEKLLGLKDIEARHIEEIMAALTKPAGKRLSLPGGLVFYIEYDRYLLASDEAALSPFPPLAEVFPLNLSGETVLSGWRITATTISREQMAEKGKQEGTSAPSETTPIDLLQMAEKGKQEGTSTPSETTSVNQIQPAEKGKTEGTSAPSETTSVNQIQPAEKGKSEGASAPSETTPIDLLQMAEKGKSEGALAPSETITPLPLDKGKGIKGIGLINNSFTAYFALDKTGDKLTVRTRQPGDRFQPLGMSQPKKLGEFMIDAKIPRAWREQIPLVCSPGQILWVVGWRIDERVKVTEDTKQVLCLKFEKVMEH